jgi:hypothetical protein
MHRDKLMHMKSAIDTRPPPPMPHLQLYGRDYVAKKRATTEAAFADLKMIQSIAKTMTRTAEIPERKGPISLNASFRKQEIYRIMDENHKLLGSLETLQPVLTRDEVTKTNKMRQRYLINASHSKRLAGDYDPDIEKFQVHDKAQREHYIKGVELKRAKRDAAMAGSASMPNLLPGTSSPGGKSPGQPVRKVRPNKSEASSEMYRAAETTESEPPPVVVVVDDLNSAPAPVEQPQPTEEVAANEQSSQEWAQAIVGADPGTEFDPSQGNSDPKDEYGFEKEDSTLGGGNVAADRTSGGDDFEEDGQER